MPSANRSSEMVDVFVAMIVSAGQTRLELGQHRLLDGHVLEDRLDDQVGSGQIVPLRSPR